MFLVLPSTGQILWKNVPLAGPGLGQPDASPSQLMHGCVKMCQTNQMPVRFVLLRIGKGFRVI